MSACIALRDDYDSLALRDLASSMRPRELFRMLRSRSIRSYISSLFDSALPSQWASTTRSSFVPGANREAMSASHARSRWVAGFATSNCYSAWKVDP